jgi:2-polyprenyl-3-methyl-5-hydroxy-6-metoxy-1,4-benzoquinol methylase
VTVYDEHVQMYLDFVDRVLASDPSLFGRMRDLIGEMLGERLSGARVLDVACGEGYLSRYAASLGAAEVTGIDISSELIEIARSRADAPQLTFRVDDARTLATVDTDAIDVAVSQMAIMDVEDHVAMFNAVSRVLRPGGAFVFSLLHPCFEGPFKPPDEHPLLPADGAEPIARVVWRYATEGHWQPESGGVRSHVGSYHRMLSTYLNELVRSGFRFEEMAEPVFPEMGLLAQVPRVMIISATAV